MASTPDVFVDPTRLRPLPRTVVPEMVKTIKPPRCPAMPYFIVVVLLNLMPCTWSFYQYHYHQNEACDKVREQRDSAFDRSNSNPNSSALEIDS